MQPAECEDISLDNPFGSTASLKYGPATPLDLFTKKVGNDKLPTFFLFFLVYQSEKAYSFPHVTTDN